MFLNSDTIKNRVISYNEGDDFFVDDAVVIEFDDIVSYHHHGNSVVTYGAYEGNEMRLVLLLRSQDKPYIVEIDSNKIQKYKKIFDISFAISEYRKERILDALSRGEKVTFTILRTFDTAKIEFDGKDLYMLDKTNRVKIEKVRLREGNFIFELTGKKRVTTAMTNLSDTFVFLDLVKRLPLFSDETDVAKKINHRVGLTIYGIVFLFGLNGYFEFCCQDSQSVWGGLIALVSVFSMIFVFLVIFMIPFYFLARWFNRKKAIKLMDLIEKDESKK